MSDTVIQLDGISKVYQSGRGYVTALNDVSLVIDREATTAIIGRSGSGKTTLLNCIGGLERPDKGEVICLGMHLNSIDGSALCMFQRQNVGFVFQHTNLLSYLTVKENIGFPLILNGIEGKERNKRIDTLIERIGLVEATNALPHELSGGEQQRIAVARAMAHQPKMLLADEPTASLDSNTGRALIEFMFEMGRDHGCTIVVSTHDLQLIDLADTVVHLCDGKIVKETT